MNKEEQTLPSGLAPVLLAKADPLPIADNDELRPGQICPRCKEARLDYDGILNLSCPRCGLALGGCFT